MNTIEHKFAAMEYRDLLIYTRLAATEKNPEFKAILERLVKHEREDFDFWCTKTKRTDYSFSPIKLWLYGAIRKVLGLTFTARLLEGNEKVAVKGYQEYLASADEPTRKRLQQILEHEKEHEATLIGQIKESKVEFMGNIVLGINDGLIELTGALVGFAFALNNHYVVAAAGFITGSAATLSMASSAFMQAQYEEGKDPRKSALYTGLSYFVVVLLLIMPFVFITNATIALIVAVAVALLIVALVSMYTSVLLERRLGRQFLQMTFFTLGVAVITFLIATFVRNVLGITI